MKTAPVSIPEPLSSGLGEKLRSFLKNEQNTSNLSAGEVETALLDTVEQMLNGMYKSSHLIALFNDIGLVSSEKLISESIVNAIWLWGTQVRRMHWNRSAARRTLPIPAGVVESLRI
jgi:reverse gyrase